MTKPVELTDIVKRLDRVEELMNALNKRATSLEDRVSVFEDCTSNWDGRFDDLERWQEKIDDRIDDL